MRNDQLTRLDWVVLGLVLLKFMGTCIYNVTFQPLAKIPGSKFAAMTSLHEFCFDVIRDGR